MGDNPGKGSAPFGHHIAREYRAAGDNLIQIYPGKPEKWDFRAKEEFMKITDKDKPIRTTPKGAWEGGIVQLEKEKPKPHNPNDITTDFQNNGYPNYRPDI